MGLASLDSALSGLRAAQQQISLLSTNISNASTPGYTRKILPQQAQIINGAGMGVGTTKALRNVDLNLERDLWTQVSSVGFYDIKRAYLSNIEKFHGPPDAEMSVAAEISRLHDSFSALANSPNDVTLLTSTVNQATDSARKINDLSKLITKLRNDAQTDIDATVTRVNALLEQIADVNKQIAGSGYSNRSTAALEDRRDEAVKELAGMMDISFFTRGDNVMVVQSAGGVELASNRAKVLTFRATNLSATTYYPASIGGIIAADPGTTGGAVDLTTLGLGGKLGGLIELRDTTFPKQMAQLDEMAHKMALRFDAQGLRLFTDASGAIPDDTAPNPTTNPRVAVSYVGFSAAIQVNSAVVNDPSLLRTGTYGADIAPGSSEIIRRVIEFSFGSVEFQQAYNPTTATSVDLLNRGTDDLQTWLGLASQNSLTGIRSLSSFADPASLIASANGALAPATDTFRLTFEESRTGLGPVNIDISLGMIADGAGDFVQDLIDHINTVVIPGLTAGEQADLAAMNVQFTEATNGELNIQTSASLVVDATNPANNMNQIGLNFLGFAQNLTDPLLPTDPYFDVQVGNNPPVRITLEPGDTDADLLAKLDAVPGLAIDTVNFALDGFLRLRPGNDFDDPDFGGDLKITGGPFQTNGASLGAPPSLSGRTSIDNGVNIASALFGTYTTTGGIQNGTFITSFEYGSETNAGLSPPIPEASFRTSYLGPGANISTEISGSMDLIDFGQKLVFEQTREISRTESRLDDEDSLREVLQKQFLDDSAVNIDEELSNLIIFQTSYGAAARVISAVDEMFQELLNSI